MLCTCHIITQSAVKGWANSSHMTLPQAVSPKLSNDDLKLVKP